MCRTCKRSCKRRKTDRIKIPPYNDMITQQFNIYEDFADFIAGLSPEKILGYHASEKI